MAISPAEAKKLTSEELRIIDQLEKQIDDTLRKDYREGIAVTYSLTRNITLRIQEEVVKRYECAGWKVKYESDYRGDGNWFTFSPSKNVISKQHIEISKLDENYYNSYRDEYIKYDPSWRYGPHD